MYSPLEDVSSQSFWYDAKELIEENELTSSGKAYEGLFELNFEGSLLRGEPVITRKRFKPIHYIRNSGVCDIQRRFVNTRRQQKDLRVDDDERVEDSEVPIFTNGNQEQQTRIINERNEQKISFPVDQYADSLLRLQTKSDFIREKLNTLQVKLDRLFHNHSSDRELLDRQLEENQLRKSSLKGFSLRGLFWCLWPLVTQLILTRCFYLLIGKQTSDKSWFLVR